MSESDEIKVIKQQPVGATSVGAAIDANSLIGSADKGLISYEWDTSCQIPASCAQLFEGFTLTCACLPFLKSYSFSNDGSSSQGNLKESVVPKCICGITEFFYRFEGSPGPNEIPHEDYSFKLDLITYLCPLICRPYYQALSKGGKPLGKIYLGCCGCPYLDVMDETGNKMFQVSTGCMTLMCFNLLCCAKNEIDWQITDATGNIVGNVNWKIDGYSSCLCNQCQLGSKVKVICSISFPPGITAEQKLLLFASACIVENIMFAAKVKGKHFLG